MGEIINPYIAGAPVTEQRMFFGREDVFQWIETSLSGQYADHILVVHRQGKSSEGEPAEVQEEILAHFQ